MKDPIMLINGKISKEDYIDGAMPALRSIPIMAIALLVGLICMVSSIFELSTKGASVLPILTLVLSLMLICFTPLLPKFQAKGLYRQLCTNTGTKEGDAILMRAMIYEDKLIFLTEENAADVEYKNIKKIYEKENTVSIITKDKLLMIFPKDGFAGGNSEQAIKIFQKGME